MTPVDIPAVPVKGKSKRGGKRVPGEGKQLGRPPKPQILQFADKGIASEVLSSIDQVAFWRFLLHADEFADAEKRKLLTARDRADMFTVAEYLTNRRDGKPAQGVFVGDTRENARDLDFGDIPMPEVAAGESQPTGKPN